MENNYRTVSELLRDKAFRNFLGVVRKYKGLYMSAVASQIVLTIISLLFAETSRRLFNLAPHVPRHALLLILSAFVILTVARLGFTFANSWAGSLLNESVAFEMRCKVLNHIQNLPLQFHESTHSSVTLNIVNSELEIAKEFLVWDVQRLVSLPISLLLVSLYLLSVHPLLGVIALCIGPLQMVSNCVLKTPFQQTLHQKVQVVREVFFQLEETLHGIREVKANQLEQSVDERMADIQRRGIHYSVLFTKIDTIRNICRDIPREFGYCLGIGVGALMMAGGLVGPGGLVAFITLLDRVAGTFTSLVGAVTNLQRSASGAKNLYHVMGLSVESKPEGNSMPVRAPSISFDAVSFHYKEESPILSDVSFSLPSGSSLALVGPSGSGKSTIIKLLYRFYDPQKGNILIDDLPITQYSLQSLREHMALVSQDIFLFDSTIAENIAVGRPGATREEIIEAARLAQAYDFIAALPRGFDADIGQRGIRLSQGQKQRLSIARAVLRNASVLILDEPTSALDVETEAYFQQALEEWARHCTRIIIAHRLSTIRNVDYVMFLDAGRVVEYGPPSDLLAAKGRFYDYWNRQKVFEVPDKVFEVPDAVASSH